METRPPLRYYLDLGGRLFPARGVRGREAMSAPFSLDVAVAGEEGLPGEPEELLRVVAAVAIARGHEIERRIAGVITEARVGGVTHGAPELRITLEPPIALLRHRADIRIFRERTVPEIVEEVLASCGVRRGEPEGPGRLDLRLSRAYDKRPYCVQHRESDLDFIHRLLEDEGIWYAFLDHGGMVLGDSPSAYEPIAGDGRLPFRPAAGLDGGVEAIVSVSRRAKMSVGKVSLRDFDLARPSLSLDVEAEGPFPGGPELYDYPGEYTDPAAGARKARAMAEALACEASFVSGQSLSPRLLPGHVFEITGSRDDGRRLVTGLTHRWTRDDAGFSCAFDAIDASRAFRPPRITEAPALTNPMTGIVTGPEGEDVHTDELGRVKVHFPWDRRQAYDDRCSDWIPVLQDNTGHSIGIPRVGWEVLVHFLEGDPDRPVVLGRVYNAEDTFPAALPAGKTKSALKSMTSPGRGGTNQIEIDDAAGKEAVSIVAQRDKAVNVAHDKGARVLRDEARTVGRHDAIEIGNDTTTWIGKDQTHTVTGDETRAVGGSRARNVAKDEASTVNGDRTLDVGLLHFRRVSKDDTVSAKDLVETVGAIDLEASVKTNTTSAGKLLALTAGAAHVEKVKKDKSESAKYARAETVGGSVTTTAKVDVTTKVEKKHVVTVGGAMGVKAGAHVSIEAGTKLALQAAKAAFSGATEVTLSVGESSVTLKDGLLSVTSSKVSLIGSGASTMLAGQFALVPSGDGGASIAKATAKASLPEGAASGGSGGVPYALASMTSGGASSRAGLGNGRRALPLLSYDEWQDGMGKTFQSYLLSRGFDPGYDAFNFPECAPYKKDAIDIWNAMEAPLHAVWDELDFTYSSARNELEWLKQDRAQLARDIERNKYPDWRDDKALDAESNLIAQEIGPDMVAFKAQLDAARAKRRKVTEDHAKAEAYAAGLADELVEVSEPLQQVEARAKSDPSVVAAEEKAIAANARLQELKAREPFDAERPLTDAERAELEKLDGNGPGSFNWLMEQKSEEYEAALLREDPEYEEHRKEIDSLSTLFNEATARRNALEEPLALANMEVEDLERQWTEYLTLASPESQERWAEAEQRARNPETQYQSAMKRLAELDAKIAAQEEKIEQMKADINLKQGQLGLQELSGRRAKKKYQDCVDYQRSLGKA